MAILIIMIKDLFYFRWRIHLSSLQSDIATFLLSLRVQDFRQRSYTFKSKREQAGVKCSLYQRNFWQDGVQSRTEQEFCHKWSKIKFLHWQYSHYSSSVITRTGEILPEVIQFWGTPKSDPETLIVWRLLGMLFSFLKLSMANWPATFLVLWFWQKNAEQQLLEPCSAAWTVLIVCVKRCFSPVNALYQWLCREWYPL